MQILLRLDRFRDVDIADEIKITLKTSRKKNLQPNEALEGFAQVIE
jgi:hypothetical protein